MSVLTRLLIRLHAVPDDLTIRGEWGGEVEARAEVDVQEVEDQMTVSC